MDTKDGFVAAAKRRPFHHLLPRTSNVAGVAHGYLCCFSTPADATSLPVVNARPAPVALFVAPQLMALFGGVHVVKSKEKQSSGRSPWPA
jgi:hypothetical protein